MKRASGLFGGALGVFYRLGVTWLLMRSTLAFAQLATVHLDPANEQAYAHCISEGVSAFNRRQHTIARERFACAHALSPSARTLRALGMTDLALDHYALARQELQAALVDAARPLTADQRTEVEALLEWMQTSLGSVQLEYLPNQATATIDRQPVQPGQILLPPGEHRLQLSAPGYQDYERSFGLSAGPAPLRFRIDLLETGAAQATRDASNTWLWVGGAGVALSAAGGLLLALGLNEIARVEDPNAATVSVAAGKSQHDRGQWLTGLGIALGSIGLIGVGTGIVLRLTPAQATRAERTAWSYRVGLGKIVIARTF